MSSFKVHDFKELKLAKSIKEAFEVLAEESIPSVVLTELGNELKVMMFSKSEKIYATQFSESYEDIQKKLTLAGKQFVKETKKEVEKYKIVAADDSHEQMDKIKALAEYLRISFNKKETEQGLVIKRYATKNYNQKNYLATIRDLFNAEIKEYAALNKENKLFSNVKISVEEFVDLAQELEAETQKVMKEESKAKNEELAKNEKVRRMKEIYHNLFGDKFQAWVKVSLEANLATALFLENVEDFMPRLIGILQEQKLIDMKEGAKVSKDASLRDLMNEYLLSNGSQADSLSCMNHAYIKVLATREAYYLKNIDETTINNKAFEFEAEEAFDLHGALTFFNEIQARGRAQDLVLTFGQKHKFVFENKEGKKLTLLKINDRETSSLLGFASEKIDKSNTSKKYRSSIVYMAAADNAGFKMNVCKFSSPGCRKSCLVSAGKGKYTTVQESRVRKTRLFFENRDLFMHTLLSDINKFVVKCKNEGFHPVVRLNGTSDIEYEKIVYQGKTVFEHFPDVIFYDYTKGLTRLKAGPDGLPRNYHLTFSLSEVNDKAAARALEMGFNVAAVFSGTKLPAQHTIGGITRPVIDGTADDMRFLDNYRGVFIGLLALGDGLSDESGFVKEPQFDHKSIIPLANFEYEMKWDLEEEIAVNRIIGADGKDKYVKRA